ncbi:MAG: GTP-binding protein [Lachnospiraceae bacterium]|nr:GTP-binding protein [Lachnospiraceae bacterium]
MTKVDIFSGFLGAGKTTLIKKLIDEAYKGEKLVLIENEFGEIGIDSGFLKDAGVTINELNSGCICCTLVGDFGKALVKVQNEFKPDRIIIEPSGVGKLSDVIRAVNDVSEEAGIKVNNFIAVVDVAKCKMYMKNFGEFFNDQIEHAATIILSRTGIVDEKKQQEAIALIREHNKDAVLVTTPWDQIGGEAILKAMEEKNDMMAELLKEEGICPVCGHHHDDDDDDEHEHHHHHHDDDDDDDHECCHHHHHDDDDDDDEHEHHHHHDHDDDDHECGCGHHHHGHHHHHADEIFASVGIETLHKFTKDEIAEKLAALEDSEKYGVILRAKGIVPSVSESFIHFDMVPGQTDVRDGSSDVIGRICVIGSDVKEDAVRELFA